MHVDKVMNFQIPGATVAYRERDVILYALGLSLGLDPTDKSELAYLFEQGLKPLPSFAMVLGHPGFWLQRPELGVDWVKILHAEQFLEVDRPLPPSGTVDTRFRVNGIEDKGPDKGAILYFEKALIDPQSGDRIARVVTGVFCRGDGGCGNHGEVPAALPSVPGTAPDISVTRRIDPRSALIYRLSGDWNPIHISPDIAAKAGYDRPILHGLCTMGIAGHVALETLAGGDPARFGGLACRFSRPVFPGDTVRVDMWKGEGRSHFRVVVEGRNEVVLDRGFFDVRAG